MRVLRRIDGSLSFFAPDGPIEVSVPSRTIAWQGRPEDAPIGFHHIEEVALLVRPLCHLVISARLDDGRIVELARTASNELAGSVADAVAEAVGCPRVTHFRGARRAASDAEAEVYGTLIRTFEDLRPKRAPPVLRSVSVRSLIHGSDEASDLLEAPSLDDPPALIGFPGTYGGAASNEERRLAVSRWVEQACADLLDVSGD